MSRLDPIFTRRLEALSRQDGRRSLVPVLPLPGGRVRRQGRELVNFSGNDYLGLADHPLLKARAAEAVVRFGTGARASRLVCGTLELHSEIEAKIAPLKGTEAALIFNSGWQANATILPALFSRDILGAEPVVFTDRLNHASLHHGCRAAGIRQTRFRHNDLEHLEKLLRESSAAPRFIVTESVFSMDGDVADVAALTDLAGRYDSFLYLDEAHATGVLGKDGMGLSSLGGSRIDLVMGTFSKALGGFGAYVAGSRALCDYLVNAASGLIYATALPPAVLGAIDAALDLVPGMAAERAHLVALAERLRQGLRALGIDTGNSATQIVPAILGSAATALEASRLLEERGFLALAIRPPTVPMGSSRLRIALSAVHTMQDIEALLAAIAEILPLLPR